jgi:hypothetical protein
VAVVGTTANKRTTPPPPAALPPPAPVYAAPVGFVTINQFTGIKKGVV